MNTNRSSKLVKFVVLALLTTCIGASLASAQTAAGKFSLPFEVRWGQAVIAPGNYSFTVNSSGSSPANTVFVRGENGSPCMIVPLAHDYSFSGKNELIVERQGDRGTIRTLRLADVGLVLFFPAPRTEGQILAQAPVLTQRLPILMAKK
ncbi:MAG: hypothetical protein ABSF71_09600 [Terriglobia bacterium]|jgi:hypothetical protein